jgi:hypothetical protein
MLQTTVCDNCNRPAKIVETCFRDQRKLERRLYNPGAYADRLLLAQGCHRRHPPATEAMRCRDRVNIFAIVGTSTIRHPFVHLLMLRIKIARPGAS